VVVGLALFIASAKVAIDPSAAEVSNKQMDDMQNLIKHQIKRSMKSTIKLQKKDVKSRESDTHEVHSLERQVAVLAAATNPLDTLFSISCFVRANKHTSSASATMSVGDVLTPRAEIMTGEGP